MNEDTLGQDLVHIYAGQYMEKIFYFCLKKTGNEYEAEDLTSDISCNILSALRRGVVPEHFSAWVWQIAHNRYCVWAKKKHQRGTLGEIDGFEDGIADTEDVEASLILHEDLLLLRRELAFISSDYRNIVVMYYLENRRVQEIAARLETPTGTVVSKLYRARKLLKEGMGMTREFGKRSYDPEKMYFSAICTRKGDSGQPWCYINSKLHQNIYLEGYEDAKTAEAFALELGVALPYMEDELERLARATLLIKNGNEYETAFPIISRDALWKIHTFYKEVMPRLVPRLEENIDRMVAQFCEAGLSFYGEYQSYEEAKWTILLMIWRGLYDACKTSSQRVWGNTARPQNGIWDVLAVEDAEFLPCQVGFTNVCGGLYQYLICYGNLMRKIPHPTGTEAIAMEHIVKGEPFNTGCAEKLISYGFVEKRGEDYLPKIAVFNRVTTKAFLDFCDKGVFSDSFRVHANARKLLHDEILQIIEQMNETVYDILYHDLPKSIRKNEEMLRSLLHAFCSMGGSHTLGYILESAVRDGWLRYGEDLPTTIGAYITI